jgi:hypothetical protein
VSHRATRAIYAAAIILAASFACTPALSEKKAESSGPSGEGTGEFTAPTAEDSAPTLSDEAETLDLSAKEKKGESKSEETTEAAPTEVARAPVGTKCVVEIGEIKTPVAEAEAPTAGEGEEAKAGPADHPIEGGECVDMTDAKPTMMGPDGKVVEIGVDVTTEDLIRQRLQERRLEIEARATDIDAQQAILEAAEKRIEKRMATLEQLQNEIDATVDQSEAAAAEQFKAVIAAYETMKPAAAAAIFNEMPDEVLLGIAKEMNPRKIASILSKMDPARAGALTVQLASAN